MSESKMREEFEAWAEANLGLSIRRTPSGAYQSFGVYSAWEAWQASREALVIELPEPSGISADGFGYREACVRAITATGLKVSK
jgi:hypothetical protein